MTRLSQSDMFLDQCVHYHWFMIPHKFPAVWRVKTQHKSYDISTSKVERFWSSPKLTRSTSVDTSLHYGSWSLLRSPGLFFQAIAENNQSLGCINVHVHRPLWLSTLPLWSGWVNNVQLLSAVESLYELLRRGSKHDCQLEYQKRTCQSLLLKANLTARFYISLFLIHIPYTLRKTTSSLFYFMVMNFYGALWTWKYLIL